ncbi:HAD family hydrolase [Thalassorhabdomicrobium marinisediminis]|uniref:Haloacid dehalogenase n=1 Tax=Thalassorhabdomicrobium marinisediminis TaxID=2170577 RepID=A0A2T7FVV9_9RHOB|nr:HAD family phosphatase [Thalassorhabdomicrobium marinisediminis]PVA06292.1 haloacid dehalogenase [Thalassorhabdomicrobium marinisediminis]
MTTIQTVIFDIGNVLIQWHPEAFFDRAIGPERRAAYFDAVPMNEMNDRVDAGENFHEALAEMAQLYPDWTAEIGIWRDRWIDMISPAIDHSVRLLRALRRAGHPVVALSNFGVETFAMAERENPFLEEFDQRILSGELRTSKPFAPIYEAAEAAIGLPPETLLFTDDRADNIEAARARGWQTHLFDGPQGWADRLVAEGLLTPEAAT